MSKLLKISPPVKFFAIQSALIIIYFFAGELGLSMALINPYASFVWPPTGIALAAYLFWGYRLWPAIFLGAFFVNLSAGGSLGVSIGIAIGNTLEGLVGAWLVNRFASGRQAFNRLADTFRFFIYAALFSTMISATLGVVSVCLGAAAQWGSYAAIWVTWWIGDLVSNIVIAPLLIIWSFVSFKGFGPRRALEWIGMLAGTILISQVVFGGWFLENEHHLLQFLCFPFLLWVAFRFGPRGACTSNFLMSTIAIVGTFRGYGPFILPDDPNSTLLSLQTFIATAAMSSLIVAVVVLQIRKAEQDIQNINLRKGSILDASLDSIISMDAEGKIIDFNSAAEKTFGYSASQVVGKELAQVIIPPSLRQMHREGLARFLKTGVGPVLGKRLELTSIRSDGSEFPVELTINAVRLNHKPIFTGYLRDLTERKLTEEKFRLVVEAAPTGMVMVDRTGKILLINSQIEKLFGYLRDELIDRSIDSLVPQRFRGGHPAHREAFFANPSLRAMGAGRDLYGLRKDWSEFPVEIGLNPIRTSEGVVVMASVIDITERKKAEEEHLRLAEIVEFSEDAIIGKTLDGVITSWNKGAERLYGYSAEEIVGRPASILLPQNKQDEWLTTCDRLKRGERIQHFETERIRKDQKRIYVSIVISPIKDSMDRLVGASAIARDVTERKLAEEALMIANKRLAELVAMKDEFVANVSHELRTPLTAIREGVSLISDGVVGPINEEQKDFLDTIDDSVNRLTELINNVLDLSKMEAGKFRLLQQRVKLPEVVTTLLTNYKTLIGHHVVETQVDGVPDVYADPDRLLQILGNLFSNAIKFTGDQGKIKIFAQKQEGWVAVSVEDDGFGIANEDLPKLFKKFSQVGKKQTKGTGLGLVLVKQLVEMHQGSIFVTSKSGKGSRFTFTLPIYVPHLSKENPLSSDSEVSE